jgi:hypothetical protein
MARAQHDFSAMSIGPWLHPRIAIVDRAGDYIAVTSAGSRPFTMVVAAPPRHLEVSREGVLEIAQVVSLRGVIAESDGSRIYAKGTQKLSQLSGRPL